MTKGDKIVMYGVGVVAILMVLLIWFPIMFLRENENLINFSFQTAIFILYFSFIPYSIYMIKKMNRIYYIHKYRIFGIVAMDIILTIMFGVYIYAAYIT